MHIRVLLAVVLVVTFAGAGCNRKSADTEDPLKKIARQRYDEGRRLFLTCDPNNFSAAIKAYDEALASWEDFPEALASWAETVSMWYGFKLTQPVFEQAYVRAQRAIRLAPNSDMGYRAMADLFRHYRDPETGKLANEEAMKSIERALSIDPKSAENLYVQGSILLSVKPEDAIRVLEQAVKYNKDLGKSYFNLASAHQMVADRIIYGKPDPDPDKQAELLKSAAAHYQAAISNLLIYQHLVPGDIGGYTSLGVVYLHNKQFAESEKMLQKAVSSNLTPEPSQAQWRGMAYIFLAQLADQYHNDLKLSRTYLERALSADPYNPQVYQQLIRIAEIQKDDAGVKKYQDLYKAMVAKAKAQLAAQESATTGTAAGSTAAPAAGSTAVPPLPPAAGATPALPGAGATAP